MLGRSASGLRRTPGGVREDLGQSGLKTWLQTGSGLMMLRCAVIQPVARPEHAVARGTLMATIWTGVWEVPGKQAGVADK